MKKKERALSLILRLFSHFSKKRKKQFILVLLLMLFASVAEVVSLGAIFPFLAVLADPTLITENIFFKSLLDFSIFKSDTELIFFFTMCFIFSAIVSGILRVLLLIFSIRVSFAAGADISNKIFFKTLFQPYSVHISRNSSEIVNGVFNKTSMIIHGVLMPIFMLISAIIFIVFVFSAIVFVDPLIAGLVSLVLSSIYILIATISRRSLNINGEKVSNESTKMIKYLQEGIGGIRNILIDNSQEYYLKFYKLSDAQLRLAQGTNQIFTLSPRYVMEAFGMVSISLIAYYFGNLTNDFSSLLPILGTLALGAQRLLPIFQQAYGNWGSIQAYKAPLKDTLELLDQNIIVADPKALNLNFEKEIRLENLDFVYENQDKKTLNKINLSIEKGSKVGIIGPTGSGKSTLMDILMGLLEPSSGKLIIDGEEITTKNVSSWQKKISHVPQEIFLSDSSIKENIAFGVNINDIDMKKVESAAKKAQISSFIDSLPKKYDTRVGENGINLSGGQRQRLGLSRAFYKDSSVIFLDEATSALDNDTEEDVMNSINDKSLNATLIIIAHRITTLKKCDKLILLESGAIKKQDVYSAFSEKN
tara:strand:- start:3929 stop:5698 length:1770 start_codon:yes stop_codon:yes gene_type:complete